MKRSSARFTTLAAGLLLGFTGLNVQADTGKLLLTGGVSSINVCQVSGGPCEYKGADMQTAHNSMDITKTDFNALVEVLQKSMDAQGIAFSS